MPCSRLDTSPLILLDLLENSPSKEYDVFVMNTVKAYEEVIDFIAAGTTPQNVIAFRPSEAAQERVTDLLSREKESELSREEKANSIITYKSNT